MMTPHPILQWLAGYTAWQLIGMALFLLAMLGTLLQFIVSQGKPDQPPLWMTITYELSYLLLFASFLLGGQARTVAVKGLDHFTAGVGAVLFLVWRLLRARHERDVKQRRSRSLSPVPAEDVWPPPPTSPVG